MGYVIAMAPCLACGKVFSFNPLRVPSHRVNGMLEPVCKACMTLVNAKREAMGLEPHPIMEGAYEPAGEDELGG